MTPQTRMKRKRNVFGENGGIISLNGNRFDLLRNAIFLFEFNNSINSLIMTTELRSYSFQHSRAKRAAAAAHNKRFNTFFGMQRNAFRRIPANYVRSTLLWEVNESTSIWFSAILRLCSRVLECAQKKSNWQLLCALSLWSEMHKEILVSLCFQQSQLDDALRHRHHRMTNENVRCHFESSSQQSFL